MQPSEPSVAPVRQPAAAPEEPTRVVGAAQAEATRVMPSRPSKASEIEPPVSFAPPLEPVQDPGEHTRILEAGLRRPAAPKNDPEPEEGTRVIPQEFRKPSSVPGEPPLPAEEEDAEEVENARDSVAETLIRWVPPITAIICAGIALWGFVYYQFVL